MALAIVLLVQIACEPELVTSIELPTEDPKLAISAFLTYGDEIHVVYVGGSIPNNAVVKYESGISNAVVMISEGNQKITLSNAGMGIYTFSNDDFPVLPGKRYQLEAHAPGFTTRAFAECTLPEDFNPQIEILGIDSSKSDEIKMYEIEFRFLDVAGIKDHYRLIPYALIKNTYQTDTLKWQMYSSSSRPLLFTDFGKEGQWIHFKTKMEMYQYEEQYEILTGFEIILCRTDENYYKFHYPFVVGNYYGGDAGAFGEPTIIHSNVTNGYGVFSGLIQKVKKVSL